MTTSPSIATAASGWPPTGWPTRARTPTSAVDTRVSVPDLRRSRSHDHPALGHAGRPPDPADGRASPARRGSSRRKAKESEDWQAVEPDPLDTSYYLIAVDEFAEVSSGATGS